MRDQELPHYANLRDGGNMPRRNAIPHGGWIVPGALVGIAMWAGIFKLMGVW